MYVNIKCNYILIFCFNVLNTFNVLWLIKNDNEYHTAVNKNIILITLIFKQSKSNNCMQYELLINPYIHFRYL